MQKDSKAYINSLSELQNDTIFQEKAIQSVENKV